MSVHLVGASETPHWGWESELLPDGPPNALGSGCLLRLSNSHLSNSSSRLSLANPPGGLPLLSLPPLMFDRHGGSLLLASQHGLNCWTCLDLWGCGWDLVGRLAEHCLEWVTEPDVSASDWLGAAQFCGLLRPRPDVPERLLGPCWPGPGLRLDCLLGLPLRTCCASEKGMACWVMPLRRWQHPGRVPSRRPASAPSSRLPRA